MPIRRFWSQLSWRQYVFHAPLLSPRCAAWQQLGGAPEGWQNAAEQRRARHQSLKDRLRIRNIPASSV
eukprot:11154427-Lingulodinium_polyedra.AAC.1